LVYSELNAIAPRHLARRRNAAAGQETPVTTALVNEVYLKLVDQSQATGNDRAHFLALASVAMRRILLDRAKAGRTQKRGGSRVAVTFEDNAVAAESSPVALLEIDDALLRLAHLDPRLARVVEYRFYGGLSEDEMAEVLGVTVRTVQRDWAKARTLLRRMLAE
jgi:RNA polymerase sigma factor (TIGR02999 family)